MAIPVTVENFANYCKSLLQYTGSNQVLTNTAPTNVTFTRADIAGSIEGKEAGTYHMKAHIDSPLYIWTDGTFEDKQFLPRKDFFKTVLGNEDPQDVAEAFYYGVDLDTKKDYADPTRDFLRLNSDGYVESTDDPGDIYMYKDELLGKIINYIVDNMEKLEFPEDIQGIIDDYLGIEKE